MDNLTHSLTGLALARAGLNRLSPSGTLLLIIAANIPDIDMVSLVEGPLRNMELHRGYTHTLLCLPVMAMLAVLITAAVTRRKLPWLAAWAAACAGVASHLILDLSMSYGTRLLLPFSTRWLYLDWFSLIDWVVLGVLAFAWLAPYLERLVSEEIGEKRRGGRGLAIFALVFFAVYGGFRALMHQRVMTQLESRIYDDVLQGPAKRMAAFPQSMNPLTWDAIVEGEHGYRLYRVSAFENFDPAGGEVLYKTTWNETLQRVSRTDSFRYSLYFARFPYWQETPAGTGGDLKEIRMTDLRFGRPGESFFTIAALVDAAGQVTRIAFGPTTSRAYQPK